MQGAAAKGLGKRTIAELYSGLAADFVGYQSAKGRPKQDLPDDANIEDGSVLTFEAPGLKAALVLESEELKDLRELVEDLYVEKVEVVTAKYCSRLVTGGSGQSDGFAGGHVARVVQQNATLASQLRKVLKEDGTMEVQIFTEHLDKNYQERNGTQHDNTTERLRKDLKKMHGRGVHNFEQVKEEKPASALLIKHYEAFLKLLG